MSDTTTEKKAKNNYALQAMELAQKLQMDCIAKTGSGRVQIYAVDEDGDLVAKVKLSPDNQQPWPWVVAYLTGRWDEKHGR